MIIIFSEKSDLSTHKVLDKLQLTEVPFLLVYPTSQFKLLSLEVGDFTFQTSEGIYKYTELSGMWMRRGYIPNFWDINEIYLSELPDMLKSTIFNDLRLQRNAIKEYLVYLFDKLPCINKISTSIVNKLVLLDIAQKANFIIPDTLVTNDINQIRSHFSTHQLISKSIDRGLAFHHNEYGYGHHTIAIDTSEINADIDMGYSIFQNQLIKQFELRIFHFFGANYAMAIFSQQDQQTEVDFRNYNREKPNRNVPYHLPQDLEKKINTLMQAADLNTGSLDIVVTTKNKYVFLEVNPVGQWEVLVANCNYDIHSFIIHKLKEFYYAKTTKKNKRAAALLPLLKTK